MPSLNWRAAERAAFACLAALVLEPWLSASASSGVLLVWLALSLWFLTTAAENGRAFPAAFWCSLAFLSGICLGLSIFTAGLATLVMLLLAGRFPRYAREAQFFWDFALGLIALALASFSGRVTLARGVLFFGLGTALTAYFSASKLAVRGEGVAFNAWVQALPVFVLVVSAVAFGLGTVLSPEVFYFAARALGLVYNVVANFVLWAVVRPIAWLFSPLFSWAESLEGKFTWEPPIWEGETAESWPFREQGAQAFSRDSSAVAVMWLLLGVALAAFLIRRLRKPLIERDGIQVHEERETLFSREALVMGLHERLAALVQPIAGLRRLWQRAGLDYARQVRALYVRFVIRTRRHRPFAPWMTPREYGVQLGEAGAEMAQLYEKARYGLRAVASDVERAKAILREGKWS